MGQREMMKNPDQINVKQASAFCGDRKETKGTDCFQIWRPEKRNLIYFFYFFLCSVSFLSLLISDTLFSLLLLFFLLFPFSLCPHPLFFLANVFFFSAEKWPVYSDSIELCHP